MNTPSFINFKNYFGEEIKSISKKSWFCNNISLTHLLQNKNELIMYHNVQQDRIHFLFSNNLTPFLYSEVVKIDNNNYTLITKRFEDKYKAIEFDFPYIKKTTPAKAIAKRWNMFTVFEYEFTKETADNIPDYDKIESIIYSVLKEFKAYN